MKRFLLIITALLFVQCKEIFDGEWACPIHNRSGREIIFGIDVNVVNGHIYARDSYFDPADNFLEYSQLIYPTGYNLYTFTSHRKTHITIGDTVSVYTFDPIDLDMFSWNEIKEKKKYSFERIIIRGGEGIYIPLDLNK